MRTSTTVGIVIAIIIFFGLATFVFSKIEVSPVFLSGSSGTQLLTQSGLDKQSLLSFMIDGIKDAIGSTISSIFSW